MAITLVKWGKSAGAVLLTLTALGQTGIAQAADTVLGRCHMGSCWWWQVGDIGIGDKEGWDKLSNPKHPGSLFAVSTRTAELEFPDDNYPDSFPKNKSSAWSKTSSTVHIYCSDTLPVYMEYDKDRKKYVGSVIFNAQGETAGATEGAGNLYRYVCGERDTPPKKVSAALAFSEVVLNKPADIFNYGVKAVKAPAAKAAPAATRIKFAKGASSATVTGTLKGFKGDQSYVIAVGKGQTMTVEQVTAGNKRVTLGVAAPNGEDMSDMDLSCNNSKKVSPTVAGDYTLNVRECMKADPWKGSYKLKVIVK